MPYIPSRNRAEILKLIDEFTTDVSLIESGIGVGTLNFVITNLILKCVHSECHKSYNEMVGLLECVKLEFYRRAVAKYEDEKVKENGDVY